MFKLFTRVLLSVFMAHSWLSQAQNPNLQLKAVSCSFKNHQGNGPFTWRHALPSIEYTLQNTMKLDSIANEYYVQRFKYNGQGQITEILQIEPLEDVIAKVTITYNANNKQQEIVILRGSLSVPDVFEPDFKINYYYNSNHTLTHEIEHRYINGNWQPLIKIEYQFNNLNKPVKEKHYTFLQNEWNYNHLIKRNYNGTQLQKAEYYDINGADSILRDIDSLVYGNNNKLKTIYTFSIDENANKYINTVNNYEYSAQNNLVRELQQVNEFGSLVNGYKSEFTHNLQIEANGVWLPFTEPEIELYFGPNVIATITNYYWYVDDTGVGNWDTPSGPITFYYSDAATHNRLKYQKLDLQISPTVVIDLLKIKSNNLADFQIINIHGQIVKEGKLTNGTNYLQLADLNTGIYTFKGCHGGAKTTMRFLKQ